MLKTILVLLLLTSNATIAMEKPEGVVYCDSSKKTVIEYRLINPAKDGTASDVDLTVNGKTKRYITAYSWFGSSQPTPKDFKFAILGEKEFDPLLVFGKHLEDAKKVRYTQCN